ncbi:MAG: hypothetical protein HOQ24_12510 [Mycobacteriaceae bacterium]|nr:hypothetical protein [Mycobacteriaceae bacterium]
MTTPTRPVRANRLLRLVMRSDQLGSCLFIPIVLAVPVALALGDPHGVARLIILGGLSLYGLWLGILGILMAVGLSRTMLRNEHLTDAECAEIMLYRPR